MATLKLNDIGTVFLLKVNTEILNKTCEYSFEIELNNVKWKVKFCKKSTDGDANIQALAVYLVAAFDKSEMEWSCDAQAVFKLFQKDGRAVNCVVKDLSKKTFDKRNPCHGIDDFIKWDDFLQNHVNENQAKFEIEISTGVLERKSMALHDMERVSAQFHVAIEGASKLTNCFSSEVVLQGVRWKVSCTKSGEFLVVYLSGNEDDIDSNWSYNVAAKFTLMSFKSDIKPISYKFVHEYGADFDWGYPKFLKWSEFIDENKKYVSRDKANLFVEMKVEQPKPIWNIQRLALPAAGVTFECCLCLDSFSSGKIFSTKCGHLFCKPCFEKSIENRNVCPTCQTATSSTDLHPIYF